MSTAQLSTYVPADGTITIFSSAWCGYCRNLKLILDRTGISYTDVDVENTPGTEQLVKDANDGAHIVPTVVYPDGSVVTRPSIGDVKAQLGR